MKIYFSAPIRAKKDDADYLQEIVDVLRFHGEVLTEHVADKELRSQVQEGMDDQEIYRRDMDLLHEADAMVPEVTQPSLGVGYEIRAAEQTEIPVLCIYQAQKNDNLSGIINGTPQSTVQPYSNIPELPPIFTAFFNNTQD